MNEVNERTLLANGNAKLLYWLLGISSTLLTGGGSAWLTSMHGLTRIHSEKIAVLESQMTEQHRQLERIDHKLDRILEQEKGQH